MKNYHEIAERIAATMRKPKGAKALTEDQFMLMAGALAVELDRMRAQARAEMRAEIEDAASKLPVPKGATKAGKAFYAAGARELISAINAIPSIKEGHEQDQ